MAKAELGQRVAAKVDKVVSKVIRAEVFRAPGPHVNLEVHVRGGNYVDVVRPDGNGYHVPHKSIIHEYNKDGRLARRYRAGNSPTDHLKMTPSDPLEGGMDN